MPRCQVLLVLRHQLRRSLPGALRRTAAGDKPVDAGSGHQDGYQPAHDVHKGQWAAAPAVVHPAIQIPAHVCTTGYPNQGVANSEHHKNDGDSNTNPSLMSLADGRSHQPVEGRNPSGAQFFLRGFSGATT